jgi:hypothetical protein
MRHAVTPLPGKKLDGFVKSPRSVMLANAGIQNCLKYLDSRIHGNDGKEKILTFYETIKL